MLTRATNQPGGDGILGTADDVHEHINQTTPFIDQNQTYTSHPSHQVFLREYENSTGAPLATGRLLDGATGGLATWDDVKAQAQTMLGITLTDLDVLNVPEVQTDPYGNFVPGAGGLPILTGDTTGHAFLDDIAHDAVPGRVTSPGPGGPGGVPIPHDADLLGDHFITGDGRGNENIGLTVVHHVFHAEHNRLFDHIEGVLDQAENADLLDRFLNEGGDERWSYGERLFQAARYVTEMEYQHGVFEEFGRTIQPLIDVLPANESGYHTSINAAVTAEFAHVVYRFGHSMLTETLPRQGFGTADTSLLSGFLNPRAFLTPGALTLTPEQAAGSIAMGMVNHAGSGIDEFVTETLRNELLGLPLDLATINMMRGRDAGVPSFQAAREKFFAVTGDPDLQPFENWQDFGISMKHPESLANFIAAYGTHQTIVDATTNETKRAAAEALVLADDDFLRLPAAASGLNDVDFWIGGLAESIIPFGGMLGATFNFVFESQLEKLQNGDRFYYLSRNIGLNLLHQLEANSFSGMIMRTTDATNIPADIFQTPTDVFDLNVSSAGLLSESYNDAASQSNPAWATGVRFTGADHITIHATGDDDRIRGGLGDDSLWGFEGNDYIVGGVGGNSIVGGVGDDVLFGMGGDDNIKGGGGNDAIHAGSGDDLVLGGSGTDFVFHGSEFTTTFAGLGDDFVLGSNGTSGGLLTGNEGNDWLEGQNGAQLLSGDNSNGFQNDLEGGHDVILGGPGNDDHDSEGGDDIMVASEGSDRFEGMFGFDWVTYRGVDAPAVADMQNVVFQPPDIGNFRSRFDLVEGLSGWRLGDILRGYTNIDDVTLADGTGHELTDEHLNRITNLRALLGGPDAPYAAPFMTTNPENNILLGGDGSDIIEGRGGENFIDGSAWLNVQLEHAGVRYDSMNGLLTGVFNGEINPTEIQVVREIVLDADAEGTINTAVFSDLADNYTITENSDGTTTVAHDGGLGTDTLRNIQRLQFGPAGAPEVVVLPIGTPPVNSPATGQPAILGTAIENGELSVDTSAIADANGVGAFTFEWQVEVAPDVWDSPASGNAGGETFTPTFEEVGQNIRVIVSFFDGFTPPTNESVTSNAVGPVVACVGPDCGPPPPPPPPRHHRHHRHRRQHRHRRRADPRASRHSLRSVSSTPEQVSPRSSTPASVSWEPPDDCPPVR